LLALKPISSHFENIGEDFIFSWYFLFLDQNNVEIEKYSFV